MRKIISVSSAIKWNALGVESATCSGDVLIADP
jgi:hypothetical protein